MLISPRQSSSIPAYQAAANSAGQYSPASGKPAHAAPKFDAPVSDRIDYCNKLLGDLKTGLLTDSQRAETMKSLVAYLPGLPGEKSALKKTKEAVTQTGTGAMRFVTGRGPSRREVKENFRTPQAEVLYAVAHHLADIRRLNRPADRNFLGFKKPTHHPKLASFNEPEVDRRRLNAAVWRDLILQASIFKESRQEKILDDFEANFSDLPVRGSSHAIEKMTEMMDAYAASFISLTQMLARPNPDSHSDTLSKQETKALDILRNFAVRLSVPAREQLLAELRTASTQTAVQRPALSTALANFTRVLTNTTAPYQLDAVPGEATQGMTAETPNTPRTRLMKNISKSEGSVTDMVSDMTSLAELLPKMSSHLRSASQPSVRTETFDFLMHHLDTPSKQVDEKKPFNYLWTPPKRELKFDGRHMDRRISVAPVWTALFSNVRALNLTQQSVLLNRFEKNFKVFDSLPEDRANDWAEKKQELLAAYTQSLATLIEVFHTLGKPDAPDTRLRVHDQALAIVREYGPQLPAEGKQALSKKLADLFSTTEKPVDWSLPGMHDLHHFKNDLDSKLQSV
ncbi:hypothetical protein [Noviherbaspirillum aerium]|uniref:hypothetical protein n=1 Tax=Noviherbaspirillum aerium TaxID=2588497 RepID=UPI00124E7957|nr:hypothetical protein [Noviherbaspirillum aerium]